MKYRRVGINRFILYIWCDVGLGGLCQWAGILEATSKDGDWISSSGRQAERVVLLYGTDTSCQCNGTGFTRTHADHGNYIN